MGQELPIAPVRTCRKVGSRKNKDCTLETLNETICRVKGGHLTQRQAAKKYDIQRSTLKYKLRGPHRKDVDRPKVLSPAVEAVLVERFVILLD